jgi:hypothetical protein
VRRRPPYTLEDIRIEAEFALQVLQVVLPVSWKYKGVKVSTKYIREDGEQAIAINKMVVGADGGRCFVCHISTKLIGDSPNWKDIVWQRCTHEHTHLRLYSKAEAMSSSGAHPQLLKELVEEACESTEAFAKALRMASQDVLAAVTPAE